MKKKRGKVRDLVKQWTSIIGLFVAFYFVIFFIGRGGLHDFHIELKIVVMFLGIAVTGLLLSWLFEKIGGILMILGGTGQATYLLFLGGMSNLQAALIFSLPFCISGIIFLVRNQKKKKRKPNSYTGSKEN